MSDTDIDTQIEEIIYSLGNFDYPTVKETKQAIKTLLIQSKIEELEAIMDFDDEPVHLNFDEEINPITVGERIDQLKEGL